MEATSFDVVQMRMNARQQRWLQDLYERISMTKFNNLKVKRVKSNLKYIESKLVKKKDRVKKKKY